MILYQSLVAFHSYFRLGKGKKGLRVSNMVRKWAPQELEIKSNCENTTKTATSLSTHDTNHLHFVCFL